MDSFQREPHVVHDDNDDGESDPNSNSTSGPGGMFSDASDETGQIHPIEPNQDEIDDVSMGISSSTGTMSTSLTNAPTSVASSWDGDYADVYAELGITDRRKFQRQTVVWPHNEENAFSAAYVCPFSGEIFLSGHCVDEFGYVRNHGGLQWYDSEERAQVAAMKRKIDCSRFRELPRDSVPGQNRHCREMPYREVDRQTLLLAIPVDERQRLQLYQRMALDAPSLALSSVSPLTPPDAEHPTLRPPVEEDAVPRHNGVLIAPLVDRNARLVLNERYQEGVINGRYVLQCAIPKSNFLFHKIGTSHQPYFTCIFVCPLFGEYYTSGEPATRDRSSAYLMHGLKWFRDKKQAKCFAAARAIDCFEYREGNTSTLYTG